MGLMIRTIILHYTRLYIEWVEAKILFGQRLWDDDSRFPYRGVEPHTSKSCIFEGLKALKRREHLYIGDYENVWELIVLKLTYKLAVWV